MNRINDVRRAVAVIKEWAEKGIDCPDWPRSTILAMVGMLENLIRQRDKQMNWFGFKETIYGEEESSKKEDPSKK